MLCRIWFWHPCISDTQGVDCSLLAARYNHNLGQLHLSQSGLQWSNNEEMPAQLLRTNTARTNNSIYSPLAEELGPLPLLKGTLAANCMKSAILKSRFQKNRRDAVLYWPLPSSSMNDHGGLFLPVEQLVRRPSCLVSKGEPDYDAQSNENIKKAVFGMGNVVSQHMASETQRFYILHDIVPRFLYTLANTTQPLHLVETSPPLSEMRTLSNRRNSLSQHVLVSSFTAERRS